MPFTMAPRAFADTVRTCHVSKNRDGEGMQLRETHTEAGKTPVFFPSSERHAHGLVGISRHWATPRLTSGTGSKSEAFRPGVTLGR